MEFLLPETPGRKIPRNSGYRYLAGWKNQLSFAHIIYCIIQNNVKP
jgi:hypothetical protein